MAEDVFDAIEIGLDAECLMEDVRKLRADVAGADRQSMSPAAAHRGRSGADATRRREELCLRAAELRERCERSLGWKRDVMAREAWDEVWPYDPGEPRESHFEWLADQCERVDLALVRVKAAIDMLHVIP